jgi:trk system potassium uptake protein TrkH
MKTVLHPARAATLGFLAAIVVGTMLLMLPAAHAGGTGAPWSVASFTAVARPA